MNINIFFLSNNLYLKTYQLIDNILLIYIVSINIALYENNDNDQNIYNYENLPYSL